MTATPHNHPDFPHARGCFGCKAASVSFSSTAMPTRHPKAAINAASEKEITKDVDAYRRFRKSGVQPKGVNGAAAMEQAAHTEFEVESGRLFKKARTARKYQETQKYLVNGGLQPLSASAE